MLNVTVSWTFPFVLLCVPACLILVRGVGGRCCPLESSVANLGLKKMAVKNRQLSLKCTTGTHAHKHSEFTRVALCLFLIKVT